MQPDLIYDVGMNNGDDTAYYLQRGYRVVAIEADPTLAQAAAARFPAAIADGRLTILNVAIAEHAGVMPFYVCPTNPVFNSFSKKNASRDGVAPLVIDVACTWFETVLQEHGIPHYLKVDIEEYDHLCLDALARFPNDLPRCLSFEFTAVAAARLPLLSDLGYDQFKLINQSLLLPVQAEPLPNQREARLVHELRRFFKSKTFVSKVAYKLLNESVQKVVDRYRHLDGWDFPMGSSGPLGEAMPGPWRSYEETLAITQRIEEALTAGHSFGFWRAGDIGWIDIHARRDTALLSE